MACDGMIYDVLHSIGRTLPHAVWLSGFEVVEHMVLVVVSDLHRGRRKDPVMRVVVAQRDDCLVPRRSPSCRLLFV